MSNRDFSAIAFSSRVFPTYGDRQLWDALRPVEQRTLIEREEDEGYQGAVVGQPEQETGRPYAPDQPMRCELSLQAAAEIDAIIGHIRENSGTQQTAGYVGRLYDSFDLLADNPCMGKAWNGMLKRRYIYRDHIVFYRIPQDKIHLLITDIRSIHLYMPPEWEG